MFLMKLFFYKANNVFLEFLNRIVALKDFDHNYSIVFKTNGIFK